MVDDYPHEIAQQMALEEQEWLADEAAQAEYRSWLASTYRINRHEPQQSD